MKQFFLYALVALLCGSIASCDSNKKNILTPEGPSQEDSSDSTIVIKDTTDIVEEKGNLPIPATIDESFKDFIYAFTSSASFQRRRILFPLSISSPEEVTHVVKKSSWNFDSVHLGGETYTVLYGDTKQMSLDGQTSLSAVTIDVIYYNEEKVKRYHFERANGKWFLQHIQITPISSYPLEDFISFYHHFANDSLFQREHVEDPLSFVTYDEENNYDRVDGILDIDQWFAFRPELPRKVITNIDYGQHFYNNGQVIFALYGNSNSMQSTFTFRKKKGEWMLVKYEN